MKPQIGLLLISTDKISDNGIQQEDTSAGL